MDDELSNSEVNSSFARMRLANETSSGSENTACYEGSALNVGDLKSSSYLGEVPVTNSSHPRDKEGGRMWLGLETSSEVRIAEYALTSLNARKGKRGMRSQLVHSTRSEGKPRTGGRSLGLVNFWRETVCL